MLDQKIKTAVDSDMQVIRGASGANHVEVIKLITEFYAVDNDTQKCRKFEDVYKALKEKLGDKVCNARPFYNAVCDLNAWLIGLDANYQNLPPKDSISEPYTQEVYKYMMEALGSAFN